MSHSTLQGLAIVEGSVTLPRLGVWHAELVLDAPAAPTGQVVLQLGKALRLVGTVTRSGLFAGRLRVRVVGGQGTLSRELPPRWYVGAPLSVPLEDLVREAGEKLSGDCDQELLALVLTPGWGRARGPASEALGSLLEGTGAGWRLLPDGSLWAGPETWPEASGMADLVVLEDHGSEGRLSVVSETPTLLPGQALRGRRVGLVEYTLTDSDLRAEVWLETKTQGPLERIKGALLTLVKSLVRRETRYLTSELGVVVKQADDGRLDIKFPEADTDTDRIPPLTGVRLRPGSPGQDIRVTEGARVLVTWEAGDARRPIATLWEGPGLKNWKVTASEKIGFEAPAISLDPAGLPAFRQGDMVMSGGLTTFAIFAPAGTIPVPGAQPSLPLMTNVPYAIWWFNPASGAPPSPVLYGTGASGNPRVKT
jgi:hypothetical protein